MGEGNHGPVALVTGGSRGVGRGVALALNAAGLRVHATGQVIAAAVARELGVLDVDGRSPEPLSIEAS